MPDFHLLARSAVSALIGVALLACVASHQAFAQTVDTPAREAIVVDYDSGRVLMEKNADTHMPTASMSKLATVFMLMEALKDGRVKMDDEFPVSEKAWRMKGSKMFVDVGSRVSIHDLLRGIIVQSGNDATVVVAEGLAGTEDAFASNMTARMHELGLSNSNFENASGWPHPDHYSTARDLATLATEIIRRFPEYYGIFDEHDFTYNGIKQGNRNPLLYRNMGVDGLKTGHTEEAGYGLVASGIRHGRRVVAVLSGLNSMQQRADEGAKLIEWAFNNFDRYTLYQPGKVMYDAPVWLGDKPTVPLVLQDQVNLTLSPAEKSAFTAHIEFQQPIPAPIGKGDRLASLVIETPGLPRQEVPLYAGDTVAGLGFMGRVEAALSYLVFGSSHS